MKKNLLMLLPVMTFVAFVMTSCSDDDDNDSSLSFDKTTIVGTWEITGVSSSSWLRITEGDTLTFNSTIIYNLTL